MEREQALQEFEERVRKILEDFRDRMSRHLTDNGSLLESLVDEAVSRLGKEMKAKKKEYVGYLYGSVLKTDLLERRYRFFFHAMDLRWYLDENPLEVGVDAKALFVPFDEVWDALTEESQDYKGMVNRYDIQNIMFAELQNMDALISALLRWRLRDWEKKKAFAELILSPYWIFKWGEYRDQSEFILQTDKVRKEEGLWEAELKKARHKPETLIFSYWYQGQFTGSHVQKTDMRFIVFDDCVLRDMDFKACDLQGSRFPKSRLNGCGFDGCSLIGADFTDCILEKVSFRGADLTGALIPAESVPFLNLDADQFQCMIPVRKEET